MLNIWQARKEDQNKTYLLYHLLSKTIPSWTLDKLYANNMEQEDFSLENDLHLIENALADEFSFLFYIGLLRDNNHKTSDYPLTTGFIRPNPKSLYPTDFLMQIVNSDDRYSY